MTLCIICRVLRKILEDALVRFYLERCIPKKLTIHPKGSTMSFKPLAIGQTATFTVVPTNAEGQVIPDPAPIIATSDNPSVATATCNPDGSGGVVTAIALGSYNVNATDGTINASPVDGTVVDLVVTTLTITPS